MQANPYCCLIAHGSSLGQALRAINAQTWFALFKPLLSLHSGHPYRPGAISSRSLAVAPPLIQRA